MGVNPPRKIFFLNFFVRDIGVTSPPQKPNFFVYGPILKILSTSLRVWGGGVSAGVGPPTPPKKYVDIFLSRLRKFVTSALVNRI
jgi:hypothetical protein